MRLPTLHQFFRHQLAHGFHAHGMEESPALDYISDILARFARTPNLYALHNAAGESLERLVDMQMEWRLAQQPTSGPKGRGRERQIMRHIGEYTLFMSGLFRQRIQAHGQLSYYIAHGRSAFWHCADVELHPGQRRMYRRLYHDFGPISNILDAMRRQRLPLTVRPTADTMLAAFWRV